MKNRIDADDEYCYQYQDSVGLTIEQGVEPEPYSEEREKGRD